jgi:hypothetical protein
VLKDRARGRVVDRVVDREVDAAAGKVAGMVAGTLRDRAGPSAVANRAVVKVAGDSVAIAVDRVAAVIADRVDPLAANADREETRPLRGPGRDLRRPVAVAAATVAKVARVARVARVDRRAVARVEVSAVAARVDSRARDAGVVAADRHAAATRIDLLSSTK